jgi:hypothetical protein
MLSLDLEVSLSNVDGDIKRAKEVHAQQAFGIRAERKSMGEYREIFPNFP